MKGVGRGLRPGYDDSGPLHLELGDPGADQLAHLVDHADDAVGAERRSPLRPSAWNASCQPVAQLFSTHVCS